LIRKIEGLRGDGWTFKEISDHLSLKGYRSTRGKHLYPQLVERMYKKYLRKIDNESVKGIEIRVLKS